MQIAGALLNIAIFHENTANCFANLVRKLSTQVLKRVARAEEVKAVVVSVGLWG
jgi:hypothetical protein